MTRRRTSLLTTVTAALLLLIATGAAAATPDTARREQLLHLLRHDCGSCHGMTLRGGLGPALTPQALAGKTATLLINTVLFGRAGTAMPPWQGELTRAEVTWLVKQLLNGGNS